MKGFSIIVCCYNSAEVIEETIRHLAALEIPPGHGAEVILVNNRCTDHTVQLVSDTWSELHAAIDLVIVDEHRPGLSYAREKGIGSSRYDYILFCDDDNRPDSFYLLIAANVLNERREIGVLGGLGIPDYETVPDYWSEDFYIYGSGPQAKKSGEVDYVHGAGILLRKTIFLIMEQAGFHFLLTDRKGETLASGGDYELCYAVSMAGYKIWYEEKLTFKHYITAERVTDHYCRRFIDESAPSIDVLDVYRYYAQHDGPLTRRFYLGQFRIIIFHCYKMWQSFRMKIRYRNHKKIVFLENFHIRFHQMRIKCIVRSFTKYKIWANQVAALKNRLNALRIKST